MSRDVSFHLHRVHAMSASVFLEAAERRERNASFPVRDNHDGHVGRNIVSDRKAISEEKQEKENGTGISLDDA